jgi:hypothetical protein
MKIRYCYYSPLGLEDKNGGRIEIQPRFKIQYPMKNHNKDAHLIAKSCMVFQKKVMIVFLLVFQKISATSLRPVALQ